MSKFVVVVLPDEQKAYEALRAMKELHTEGTVSLYGASVVERKKDGKLDVKQNVDQGPLGVGVGSLVGGFLGLFGGPVGAAAGMATGGLLGGWSGYMRAGVSEDFVETVTKELAPGKFAVIAEVSEDWVAPIDTRMEALGGTVTREWRDDFIDDSIQKRADAFKSDINQRQVEHAGAKAEKMQAKLQTRLEEARKDLQKTASKARARLDEKKQEINAKVKALEEQAAKAEPDVRNRIQQRIAELRADAQEREKKLNRAWEIAQEALA